MKPNVKISEKDLVGFGWNSRCVKKKILYVKSVHSHFFIGSKLIAG